MHEYSLACDIIENVISTAELNNAKEVKEITLGVGKLTHVNPEQILFCMETLVEDTIARGARIIIQDIYPDMECECGFSENGEHFYTTGDISTDDIRAFLEVPCPACGKILHASGGMEIIIQSIDIEQ
ncbi:hydrogenase/urease maturation nickel metallochaperone HypA [Methanolobus sp. ZRKC3]|uniref:hydrogenase/urease maturation nickel metallochaperone HypA n=1 Tax=Methanolobus sp. ZRKC3 TaxID=3125786 RepID=UPI003248833F